MTATPIQRPCSVVTEPLVAMLRAPHLLTQQRLSDWDRTLRLARATNLLGRVAAEVLQLGTLAEVPGPVQQHLVAADRLFSHQQQSMVREARHISEALQELDIPVVLLKGAAYAIAGHAAAKGRLFGDVDVLVPQAAIPQVEAALMKHGWATGGIDPYDSHYYRQWMHELPPMTHVHRGTVIDVHHNILPLTCRDAPDATKLIQDSVSLPGTTMRVLASVDIVIHSAVHLFHEGELRNGLRDLLDLHTLLSDFALKDAVFWPLLTTRAKELGLAWPLHLALRFTGAVFATEVPADIRRDIETAAGIGRTHQAWLDSLYLRALLPQHPLTGGPAVATARLALYLRAHALRMSLPRVALHLGRKAVLRTVKHSSRRAP